MTIKDAAALLIHPGAQLPGGIWADLGCGNGTFTMALASLLPPNSIIYAIDEQRQALKNIPTAYQNVTIKKQIGNFLQDEFPFEKADGILMANALHYVKDKELFLAKIKQHLAIGGSLLVVEYDTDKPVDRWVPYPVSFKSLQQLFTAAGFSIVKKLHSRPSAFGGEMYSALISF